MQAYRVHTIESAPEKSKQPLQVLQKKFGYVPSVAGNMAESPVLLNAFIGGFANFHGGSFNESEKQVLLLTNAVTLKSSWTVAFHSTEALHAGVTAADVKAIRAGSLPADPRYAALSNMAKSLIEKRGKAQAADVDKFLAAGYSQTQILEVIAGIGISTMAATTGNLSDTPIDERFKAQSWTAA